MKKRDFIEKYERFLDETTKEYFSSELARLLNHHDECEWSCIRDGEVVIFITPGCCDVLLTAWGYNHYWSCPLCGRRIIRTTTFDFKKYDGATTTGQKN